jgi:hypothetical protein
MKRLISLTTVILISGMIAACCSSKKAETMKTDPKAFVAGPKAIIYQTKKDYSKLVPVILSDDKKAIVSYPDIKDVYYNGSLAYPTQLNNGYWLDNRGISANVAFINLTYEAYSKLTKTPSPDELMKMIIDTEPLSSMYSCELRSSYKDILNELNAKIDADDFSTFIKLK